MRGARGVLVNITGSRSLGLHEVNKACTLIRDAAGNEDVEINFGVVLNEAMGDEVKVTVIATGFERAGLPSIARRPRATDAPVFEVPPAPVAHTPPPAPAPAVEASRGGDCLRRAGASGSAEPEPQYEEISMAAAAHANGTPEPFEDLDVPAILKRDRRFVQ